MGNRSKHPCLSILGESLSETDESGSRITEAPACSPIRTFTLPAEQDPRPVGEHSRVLFKEGCGSGRVMGSDWMVDENVEVGRARSGQVPTGPGPTKAGLRAADTARIHVDQ